MITFAKQNRGLDRGRDSGHYVKPRFESPARLDLFRPLPANAPKIYRLESLNGECESTRMDENALIGVKCPNCEHVGAETLAHLKGHWDERFRCESCGIDMSVDREELLNAIGESEPGASFTITMHKAQ